MDEGMTTYAEEFVMDKIYNRNGSDFLRGDYNRYYNLVAKNPPVEEPMSTPADLFSTNFAYIASSYSKGAIMMNMLRYIMGDAVFYRAMMTYYKSYKFKHPTPNDFWRLMESQSGLELDWFFQNWLYTTHHIDYGVKVTKLDAENSVITLRNFGEFPMPIDLVVTKSTGEQINYHIPLRQMRGTKRTGAEILESWAWVNPEYAFEIEIPVSEIASVEFDPQHVLPDVDRNNNMYPSITKTGTTSNEKGKKKK
jgi:aminopeptidase N